MIDRRLCTPEQAEQALRDFGLLEAVREKEPPPRPTSPPRKPTRQDYIELGVDPAVLDSIGRSMKTTQYHIFATPPGGEG